jgi:hypothetical protein
MSRPFISFRPCLMGKGKMRAMSALSFEQRHSRRIETEKQGANSPQQISATGRQVSQQKEVSRFPVIVLEENNNPRAAMEYCARLSANIRSTAPVTPTTLN